MQNSRSSKRWAAWPRARQHVAADAHGGACRDSRRCAVRARAGVGGVQPLGTRTFRLISVAPFKPESLAGQKMEARGLIYNEPGDERINLTSLRATGGSCASDARGSSQVMGRRSRVAGFSPRASQLIEQDAGSARIAARSARADRRGAADARCHWCGRRIRRDVAEAPCRGRTGTPASRFRAPAPRTRGRTPCRRIRTKA